METEECELSRVDEECSSLQFLFSEHFPVQLSHIAARGAQKRTLDIHREHTVLESHMC